jgi:aspartate aminotransferase
VIINSPGNPTGWTLPPEARVIILEHCRKLGVWLICDDVYERLSFDLSRTGAPSFLEISDAEDRLIAVNSFSKAWLMTGWRLGWMVAPGTMETDIGKLIEYNTSCAPDFIQAGGLAAIEQGEPHVRRLRSDLVSKRDLIVERLSDLGDVFLPPPGGGMYAFFKIAGFEDSVGLAKQLISEAKLGLAPGAAFGPVGEGWLRWCFAADQGDLNKGIDRLTDWLRKIRS